MNAARALVGVLVGLIALIIVAVIGYSIGFDTGRGSLKCDEGLVLSVTVTGADSQGNGTHALNIGNCERIDEEVFISAVEALAGTKVDFTTTTSTTTITTTTTIQ